VPPDRAGGRPGRNRLRERLLARANLELPDLPQRTLDVGGRPRTYSMAAGPRSGVPLVIALHGAGGTGLGMAALTNLHERGPAAGFVTVFPDGVGHVWNDERDAPRLARREGVDDVGFLQALVHQLVAEQITRDGPVFVTGISNGAFLTEHVARHALLPIGAIGLVAGTATGVSRQAVPVPRHPTVVVTFAGTADPLVPYRGGPIGPLGRLAQRRGARRGEPGRGVAAPVEAVMADWVAANGCAPDPTVEPVGPAGGALPVTRLAWQAAGPPSVTLYRIEGGGHSWPGGAAYLPRQIIGPVASDLDATGIVLDAFTAATAE
jgi:polyhydroxybutyrate depolymerase